MKAFVTGADGLLGSSLVRELLKRDHSVRVMIQPGSKSRTLEGLPLEKAEGDLLGDRGAIADAMDGCDVAFHCAAITDQWADPDVTWKVNFDGTKSVLEGCARAKIKRLIFVGSGSSFQFGPKDQPGDETKPFPKEYRGVAYPESKHKAMHLVLDHVKEKKIDALVVAPTFMFGPYDSRPSSGELIRQFIVRGLRILTKGGRNFLYAPHGAEAMVNAVEKGKSGEIYILGGENHTYMEFFTMVAKIAGIDPPRFVLPNALVLTGGAAGSVFEKISGRKAMINYTLARLSICGSYYNPAKAEAQLGLKKTDMDKAIEDSIASLKEYGHLR